MSEKAIRVAFWATAALISGTVGLFVGVGSVTILFGIVVGVSAELLAQRVIDRTGAR